MRSLFLWLLSAALLLFVPFHPVLGQAWEPGTDPASPEEIRLHVPRVAQGPPMDPALTHPLWERAARLDRWAQTTPGDNTPPIAPTVALLLHDDDALYIGIHAYDEPDAVRYAMHRRDVVHRQAQDYIGLHLDPFNDRRQTFYFVVNPVGAQGDGIYVESGRESYVPWDGIFDTSGEVDPDGGGYRVVFRIPFKTLRFRAADPQVWGISLTRRYGRNEAEDTPWTLDRNRACAFCQMGEIVLNGVTPGRNLEINPALVANTSAERPGPQDPMGSLTGDFEPSVNFKYGMTSNLTLDATLNPDFSQVESDAGQLEVNNRFALFFQEARPFFNEGADLFITGIGLPRATGAGGSTPLRLFHSRTIAEPDWGAKLTGKSGRMGVGIIAAGDAAAPVDLSAASGGARSGVGRLTWDVGEDGYVGAMATHRDHRGRGDQVGSVDARIRISDNLTFRGLAATSRFSSPWEGFQPATTPTDRPIPVATSTDGPVTGEALQLQANYQSRSWAGGVGILDITPDFRTPLGFVPRTDQLLFSGAWAWIWRGTGFIRRFQPGLTVERTHEHGESGNLMDRGRLTDQLWEPGVVMDLAGASQFQLRYSRSSTLYRERLFPTQDRVNVSLRSNAFARAGLETSVEVGEAVIFRDRTGGGSPLPGWVLEGNLSSILRPHTSVRLDVGARGSRIWRRSEASARESHYADALIPRLRSEIQFTPRLGFRGIAEYRDQSFFAPEGTRVDQDQEILLDVLFSYVINYGSAFYVGWTELHLGDDLRSPVPTRRGGVAKATYVWRF